jgi:hypothetical protein
MFIALTLANSVFQVRGGDAPREGGGDQRPDRDGGLGFLNNLAPSDLFAMPALGSTA